MKKYILGFMVLGMVVFGAHKAKAATLDDLANQISILMQQISELKSELSAAVALTRTTTTATTDTRIVAPTTTTTTTVAPVTTTTVPVITETRVVTPTNPIASKVTTAECVAGGGSVQGTGHQGTTYKFCVGGSLHGEGVSDMVKPVVNPTNPTPPVDAKVTASACTGGGGSVFTTSFFGSSISLCAGGTFDGEGVSSIVKPVVNPTNPNPSVNTKTTTPENSTIPTMTSKISFGVRNNTEVKAFQQKLLDLGYLSNSSQVSGNYLGVTKTAIMKFQKDNGLKADGVWGTKTAQSLLSSVNPAPKNETRWRCIDGSNHGYESTSESFCSGGCTAGGGTSCVNAD